jgi:hypothetical protein
MGKTPMREVIQKLVLVPVVFLLLLPECLAQSSIDPVRSRPGEKSGFSSQHKNFTPEYVWQKDYCSSSACSGCHDKIFAEYLQSMHSQSFTNPVFQAQFFNEVVPIADQNEKFFSEARKCIACHAPITFLKTKGVNLDRVPNDPRDSGVICDFCHSISDFEGEKPGNGNYITTPGEQEFGPLKCKTYWHHVYSELQIKSEFCAICHNQYNSYCLEIKSTYTEWLNSKYAKEGIQCQDCHMNVEGFLTGGKPTYDSGKASHGSLAYSPDRVKLYTHRFLGAHSKSQVIGAITLGIEFERIYEFPGNKIKIDIQVDNSRTGHKMPSGSADLRLLWLTVNATVGDKVISIPATSKSIEGYDVSGLGSFDQEFIGTDIPNDNRIYRAIYLNKTGKQTQSSFDAVKIAFDNRLEAAEISRETYYFLIPQSFKGKVLLVAQLQYLPYPSSFANRYGLPLPEAVVIATAKKEMSID